MNASSSKDFAVDLGYQLRRFINLEDAALARLSEAADLDNEAVESLISWTGRAVGDVRTEFRGEIFMSRAARNPIMRGCPICLREDIQAGSSDPLSAMVMRGDWMLRDVSICCRHHHALVSLWESKNLTERYDIGLHLGDLSSRIIAGELDHDRSEPTPYDLWLDSRLQTGEDPTGLAGHGLYVATTMCNLLGASLIRHKNLLETSLTEQQSAAQAAGFEVLAKGEAAFRAAIKSLADQSAQKYIAPKQAFGKLYSALEDYLTDEGFNPFRNSLRDCILETWPITAGTKVLGEFQSSRRLHTPTTAAKETGLSPKLIEQFLIDKGALPETDPRSLAMRTFSATEYADLLAEIPTLVGPREMRAAMGATKAQLKSLSEDGILRPRTMRPKIRSTWQIGDGLALIAELAALANPIAPDGVGWELIQQASFRTGIRVGDIIGAVRKGELQLGRKAGVSGYKSFMVLKSEIDHLAGENPLIRRRAETLPKGQIASALAASIGMRSTCWFFTLYQAGHVNARWVHHPVTQRKVLYVTEADIATFHQRFLTPVLMQREFGLHHRTCLARLRTAGIMPFAPDGHDYGPLYERMNVVPVLQPAKE